MKDQKLDRLHERLKVTKHGRTLYFEEPVEQMNYDLMTGKCYDDWLKVTEVTVYKYQPRKRLLWVQVPKGKLKNSRYRDNLQPLRLSDCARLKLKFHK